MGTRYKGISISFEHLRTHTNPSPPRQEGVADYPTGHESYSRKVRIPITKGKYLGLRKHTEGLLCAGKYGDLLTSPADCIFPSHTT